MGVWNTYENRINILGTSQRGVSLKRDSRRLLGQIPTTLSYQTVTVYDQQHGYNITSDEMAEYAYTQNVGIINSDNLDEKYIYSLPGEDIEHGSLIYWMDNYWLVAERDANTTMYTRAKLLQCNHLLRWVAEDGEVIEQWCVVEDGTKLKHGLSCNSLVCWKRHAKRTPLIAGNTLELPEPQRKHERWLSAMVRKSGRLVNQQPSLYRGRFNDYLGRESRIARFEMGSPKPLCGMVKI